MTDHLQPVGADCAIAGLARSHDGRSELPEPFSASWDGSPGPTLASLWLKRIEEHPEATALRCGDVALTSRELNERASAIADRVLALAQNGQEIAIVAGRGSHLVVAIIAAALSGRSSSVLSPSMWRLDLIAATSGKIVLTERALLASFPSSTAICVDDWGGIERLNGAHHVEPAPPKSDKPLAVGSSKAIVAQHPIVTFVDGLKQRRFHPTRIALFSDTHSKEFLPELWAGLLLSSVTHLMPAATDSLATLVKTLPSEAAEHGSMSIFLTAATADALLAAIPDLLSVTDGLIIHGTGVSPAHSAAIAAHAASHSALVTLTGFGQSPELFLPISPADSDPLVAIHEAKDDALLVVADKSGDPVEPGVIGHIWLRSPSGAFVQTGVQGWKTPAGRLEIFVSAEWNISHVFEPERSRLISYWRERLADLAPCIHLPQDRHRAPKMKTGYASIMSSLPPELEASVTALGRKQNASVQTILLAAFALVLQRYNRDTDIAIGMSFPRKKGALTQSNGGVFTDVVVVRPVVSASRCFSELVDRLTAEVARDAEHRIPFADLVEVLRPEPDAAHGAICQAFFAFRQDQADLTEDEATSDGLRPMGLSGAAHGDLSLNAIHNGSSLIVRLAYSTAILDEATASRIVGHFVTMITEGVNRPEADLALLEILPTPERDLILKEWACGPVEVENRHLVHERISAQVKRSPSASAVVDAVRTMSYRELDEAANALAVHLQSLGVGPDSVVGVYMGRSGQTVVALLGILKAGAAYLPLDPEYPSDRLAFMVSDSGAAIVVSTISMLSAARSLGTHVVPVDTVMNSGARLAPVNTDSARLAYLIYTSGSTGRPKGVRVTHGNLATFLTAMDAQFGADAPGTWLAVTSISFDISVLEIFWTLTKGFRVVIRADQKLQNATSSPPLPARPASASERPMEFSLFFFGNAAPDSDRKAERYRLLFEAAKFADQNGFTAIWTPERHFHAFGGLYPNPSVLSAALAATTQRISIRAGSVVLPLHDPLRVAEEWALVDNLSGGRIGIAFASGWQPDDFVLASDRYEGRKQEMLRGIGEVRKLWKGDTVRRRNGVGKEIDVSVYPRPVQGELPIWLTSSRHPETFVAAGEAGAGVLTHLIGQSLDELAEKIAIYRDAWNRSGRPGRGHVTLMVHTFVGNDVHLVKDLVRQPLKDYIRSSYDLMAGLGVARGVNIRDLPEQELEGLLDLGFERFFAEYGLLGSIGDAATTVAKLSEIGVDEVGCLIDFGIDDRLVLEALPHLASARELYLTKRGADETTYQGGSSVIDDMRRHDVSHIQCTPTLASMLLAERGSGDQMQHLHRLLVGGEALPPDLASALANAVGGTVHNMYGPTEATVWATSCAVSPDQAPKIGRPLPGYRTYVVDAAMRPVPIGVAGELMIAGGAVADGYHARPELTSERFTADRFSGDGHGRLYHTGDLVRWLPSGDLEFLGRVDHQVKLRGRRIELGEIEAAIGAHEAVKRVVCDVRGDGDGRRLVAYGEIVAGHAPPTVAELRTFCSRTLPEYMVPSDFVWIDALPQTPNGKISRQALPDPVVNHNVNEEDMAPLGDLEEKIAAIWREVLEIDRVGRNDNFFSLGGNSVLIVGVRSLLIDRVGDVSLVDLFRHPTVATLATAFAARAEPQEANNSSASRAAEAAERRLAASRSRRKRTSTTGAPA
ncbi:MULTISPECIES: MupA/Atu3671 family FMN-dependent luciferase-like monooxygenase [unclassified Bradyrhizobium]|uniref:MupA/Atu3671 family FMN-dependent luciferase-like monooxygenase n=1 Tax=Bradyrhizobium TaxID=374 RepID=UPI00291704A9|nr:MULTISPECIES: MupA/Atu3671 family FMN-dependent luciferase-like monooxygenase [unclassified Bradyrhizobium]